MHLLRSGEAKGKWSSTWGHRHWRQPFLESCFATSTLVLASIILESSLINTHTQPSQQPDGTSTEMPQAKQLAGWDHSSMHQQGGCLRIPLNPQLLWDPALPIRGARTQPLLPAV